MSHPPAAPVQYAHPSAPAAQPPPKKKKRGCCSCCLWLVLIIVILSVSFVVAAQFIMRTPSNPVKEEYESIPDYFSLLTPENRENQSGNQEIRKSVCDSQFAVRNSQSGNNHEPNEGFNPQSAIRNQELTTKYTKHTKGSIRNPQSAIRNPKSECGTRELRKEVCNSQFAIRNSQWFGGNHV